MPLVAVTHHAAERFRQRVGSREGALDVKPEIVRRVAHAVAAGRAEELGGGEVRVRDLVDRDVVFVCRESDGELVVISLWEAGRVGDPRVPRRFTDALARGAGGGHMGAAQAGPQVANSDAMS